MNELQAELAQEQAEQQQGAGLLAEAAALSSQAHKWRNRAAKVIERSCYHMRASATQPASDKVSSLRHRLKRSLTACEYSSIALLQRPLQHTITDHVNKANTHDCCT